MSPRGRMVSCFRSPREASAGPVDLRREGREFRIRAIHTNDFDWIFKALKSSPN